MPLLGPPFPSLQDTIKRQKLTPLIVFVTFGALLSYPIYHLGLILLGIYEFGFVDYKAYYLAGLRARHALPLYNHGYFVHTVPDPVAEEFLYPPIVAYLFIPFTYLPIRVGAVVWILSQLAALIMAVKYLIQQLSVSLTPAQTAVVAWLTIGFYPTIHWMRLGQITGFLVAAVAFSMGLHVSDAERDGWITGMAIMLAALIKPYYAATGTFLAEHRNRVLAAIATGGLVTATSLILLGVGVHREYLEVLLWGKGWGSAPHTTTVERYTPLQFLGPYSLIVNAAVLLVTLLAIVNDRRQTGRISGETAALGSVALPLILPVANTLLLAVTLPGLLLATGLEYRRRGGLVAIPVFAMFTVHVTWISLKIVRDYGPSFLPAAPWNVIDTVFLTIQPATIGLALLIGLLLTRVVAGEQTRRV